MSAPSVVVINDDALLVTLLEQAIADEGFHAIGAVGTQQGIDAVHIHQPDLVILDAPYDATSTDWFVIRFTSQGEGTDQVYRLPMPLQLDDLRTTLSACLSVAMPARPIERSRGAENQ